MLSNLDIIFFYFYINFLIQFYYIFEENKYKLYNLFKVIGLYVNLSFFGYRSIEFIIIFLLNFVDLLNGGGVFFFI